jgi:hypothetical protein
VKNTCVDYQRHTSTTIVLIALMDIWSDVMLLTCAHATLSPKPIFNYNSSDFAILLKSTHLFDEDFENATIEFHLKLDIEAYHEIDAHQMKSSPFYLNNNQQHQYSPFP